MAMPNHSGRFIHLIHWASRLIYLNRFISLEADVWTETGGFIRGQPTSGRSRASFGRLTSPGTVRGTGSNPDLLTAAIGKKAWANWTRPSDVGRESTPQCGDMQALDRPMAEAVATPHRRNRMRGALLGVLPRPVPVIRRRERRATQMQPGAFWGLDVRGRGQSTMGREVMGGLGLTLEGAGGRGRTGDEWLQSHRLKYWIRRKLCWLACR